MDRRTEIERLAYELYEKSGRIGGRELDNWVEAERLISSYVAEMKMSREKAAKPGAVGGTAKPPAKTTQS
ncbi:MAG: DUF2934 domain-containing protein [Nitrospiraceae bacterium]|nr:DUF2934 domain-containing protein [Nitrospiraceae bacterium]